jgi:hypothetical protein
MRYSCWKHRRLAVLAAYHELPSEQQEWFTDHMAECDACRKSYSALLVTLGTASSFEIQEDLKSSQERYWTRLSVQLVEEATSVREASHLRWKPSYQLAMAAVAALLLVALGIVIGRFTFKQPAPAPPVQATGTVPGPGDTLSVAQAQHASEYLDRSKVLILGILNNRPDRGAAFQASFQRQQRVSRELIGESCLLQEELANPRQARLRSLVGDLERILSQIASMDAEHSLAGVEVLKSGLTDGTILFKINVEQMNLDDRLHPLEETPQHKGS